MSKDILIDSFEIVLPGEITTGIARLACVVIHGTNQLKADLPSG